MVLQDGELKVSRGHGNYIPRQAHCSHVYNILRHREKVSQSGKTLPNWLHIVTIALEKQINSGFLIRSKIDIITIEDVIIDRSTTSLHKHEKSMQKSESCKFLNCSGMCRFLTRGGSRIFSRGGGG